MTERERYLELMARKAQRADPVERVVTLLTIELAGGVDTGIRFSIVPQPPPEEVILPRLQPEAGLRRRQVKDESPRNAQDDMLGIASEMKEIAGRVHGVLRSDQARLAGTREMQDKAIESTSLESSKASAIGRNSMSLFKAIWMVATSLIVFICLVFIIFILR